MVPKPTGTHAARNVGSPRLPPLPRLKVKHPNAAATNPCLGVLSSVLSCWASSGYTAAGCIALEQSLRMCMDVKRPENNKKNTINYHLARMYPKIVGPQKRK
ncbi:mitochondrial ribosomal protein 10 [Trichodelitschia bisporula]|uniref:Small ribosomal subunit protein mS37 n=1 Tax=Trichodelitschia bisporula TaxID=703511 RepID=A0A6G1HYZ8_9PEZI|nr:mitochondrial ribosomal protein 10 [Trichodelitschia bisporula]